MSPASYDSRFHRYIENMDQIPSLSAVVSRLIAVVNSSVSSAEDVAELIEKDPALTSKVLRLANSAFYGVPRSVSSIQSAVVVLGFNTLKSIVLSASVTKLFSQKDSQQVFDRVRFWKHSIVCGFAAKNIAQNHMYKLNVDPQSAFCAGIMHDIGKLIFELFTPTEYSDVCGHSLLNKTSLLQTEVSSLGINHADIGRILADKWALPLDLEYAIVYHHSPQNANKIKELVTLVHIADRISHTLNCGLWDDEISPPEWSNARKSLFINDTQYQGIIDSTANEIDKYQDFLAIIEG
jgi:HD-like signal output (HDOD) protein